MTSNPDLPIEKSKSRWWSWLLLVAVLASAWLSTELYAFSQVKPPKPDCTLSEFAATMNAPRHLTVMSIEGDDRLVWIGDVPMLALYSGRPCYVFGADGKLIDWGLTGEGGELDDIALQAFQQPAIGAEEAIERLK